MPFAILLLPLGAFAIGTGNFVFVGVLEPLAADLDVTVATAGQLTTAFAVAYALSAPLLVALTTRLPRKPVLLWALALFVLANVAKATAGDFGTLLALRVIGAIGAAVYMPVAIGVAVTLAPDDRRGRAMAVVLVGLTAAFMVGIPAGTWIGTLLDWRATFLFAALVGMIALVSLALAIPPIEGNESRGLRGLGVLLRPVVAGHLSISTLAFVAVFSTNAFIGPLITAITGFSGYGITAMQVLLGVGGVLGVPVGGWLADRHPKAGSVAAILAGIALAQPVFTVLLAVPAGWFSPEFAIVATGIALFLASAALFALGPVQQQRLIHAGSDERDIVLSLNASALFLGQGLGAALGGVIIALNSSLVANGLAGGLVALLAIILVMIVPRRHARAGG